MEYLTTCKETANIVGWDLKELNSVASEHIQTASKADGAYPSELVASLSLKLSQGQELSPSELLLYMEDYGLRLPGKSGDCFSKYQNSTNQNTYEWMLEPLKNIPSRQILDIGCGVGTSFEFVSGTHILTGVDISVSELDLARRRFPDDRHRFVKAEAQDLPFESGIFDFAVCHMALMLFNPLEPALSEILRVLAPDGTLVALFPSMWTEVPEYTKTFNMLMSSSAKASFPNFPNIGVTNGRLKSEEMISALISEVASGRYLITFEDTLFTMNVPTSTAVEFVSQLYWFDLLDCSTKLECKRAFQEHFKGLVNNDGLTKMTRPFCRMVVRKLPG